MVQSSSCVLEKPCGGQQPSEVGVSCELLPALCNGNEVVMNRYYLLSAYSTSGTVLSALYEFI